MKPGVRTKDLRHAGDGNGHARGRGRDRYRIAYTARDSQGLYLALGLVSLIGMQAALNMGVVMGLLPTKGLTLPFLSYGGTSLMVSCAAVGILLNISSQSSAS